jgi:archaellum component FlaF (FlaF/FlaG flagellin family)
MRTKIFFLAMLASVIASAQRTTPVTIANTKVDYSTKIVTFNLSWKGSDATHRDEVWVFVDIQPVTGANTLGSWSPATLVPSATTVTASSGNQYSSLTHTVVSGNTRGVWVKGTSSVTTNTFSATVKLTLDNATPAHFNACAYATDYPPNAASYSGGTYTLKGTQPFTITGNGTIQNGNKYVGTVINSFTDATGCPCVIGRDVPVNGCICAPGLIALNGYCRDLVADGASAWNGLEIKHYNDVTWGTCNANKPVGWRFPTEEENCLLSGNGWRCGSGGDYRVPGCYYNYYGLCTCVWVR